MANNHIELLNVSVEEGARGFTHVGVARPMETVPATLGWEQKDWLHVNLPSRPVAVKRLPGPSLPTTDGTV